MANIAMSSHAPPISPPGQMTGLLASCKGTVYVFKNNLHWEDVFGNKTHKFLLIQKSGSYIMFVVNDVSKFEVKARILLRANTVFKQLQQNFFSILDNGLFVWGFSIQPPQGETFAVVLQNILISIKDAHKAKKPVANIQEKAINKLIEPNGDQQQYLNNICLTLSEAIRQGNDQFASELARQLATKKAAVLIRIDDLKNSQSKLEGNDANTINLKVQVEDKEATGCSFRLDVAPQITLNQLKHIVQAKFQFPTEIQRWIISKRLPNPHESLLDCGIRKSGHTVYLYLVSVQSAGNNRATPPVASVESRSQSLDSQHEADILQRNDPQNFPTMPLTGVEIPALVGWECPQCTYLNSPLRPGCEICTASRPENYKIPEGYVPDEKEQRILEQERNDERLLLEEEERQKRVAVEQRNRNYQQLMSVALREPLISNHEEIECPICFDTIPVGEGVVLRECLHSFCRFCLVAHINASQNAEIQCPFDNGVFQCHDIITTQEIQELLSEEDFQKYLQRSLSTAEHQEKNSFHCQTPNCHGWCIYDDEVNDFDCPVCHKRNCLTCKAIHFPVNCKDYQDDLKRKSMNDEAAKKTQAYLEEMLRTKGGMKCPQCGIILIKKDGCDWMKCSMCKTEICWAVRGPRWGPGGPGDTSGGCKCRVNNVKCHPNCQNCH